MSKILVFISLTAAFLTLSCTTVNDTQWDKEGYWQPIGLPGGFPSSFVIIHGFRIKKSDNNKSSQPPKDKTATADGSAIYKNNCHICHGDKGLGDGPMASKLKKKPANLQKISDWNDFFIKVSDGRGEMPAWKDKLSEHEIKSLISYISQSLKP